MAERKVTYTSEIRVQVGEQGAYGVSTEFIYERKLNGALTVVDAKLEAIGILNEAIDRIVKTDPDVKAEIMKLKEEEGETYQLTDSAVRMLREQQAVDALNDDGRQQPEEDA